MTPSVEVASIPTPNCIFDTFASTVNITIRSGHTSDLEGLQGIISDGLGVVGVLDGEQTVDVSIRGTGGILICSCCGTGIRPKLTQPRLGYFDPDIARPSVDLQREFLTGRADGDCPLI